MSTTLAQMLRKSTNIYNDRWVEQTKTRFDTEPRPETVAQHNQYWDAICRAVETSEFEELLGYSRDAGRFQSSQGYDLSDAVRRTVEATNLIELTLLEANEGHVPPIDIINEVAELRSMIVMAVAEGYKVDMDSRSAAAGPQAAAREELRALLIRKAGSAQLNLGIGDEVPPLYEAGMRFHLVDSGKLRLYNLLPNGRCITLSILGKGDVFLQWGADSGSLSCLCAEAMQPTVVISVSEREIADVLAQQPTAALDVITNFARRLTESSVLIEDLMNNSVNLRLYRTLVELSREFGKVETGGSVIDFPLTHQRLADMIGSNRVTVTRKLHELQERGIIETRKNSTIVVKQADQLEKLAAS